MRQISFVLQGVGIASFVGALIQARLRKCFLKSILTLAQAFQFIHLLLPKIILEGEIIK